LFTENGVLVDLDEIGKVVNECDVFTIGFGIFPQRVIVDSRETADVGPMVQIVEPVASVEERFHWLGRERPAFGVPRRFTFFVWPHSIQFMEGSGLWRRIRDRLVADERAAVASMMDGTLAELRALETQTVHSALAGDGFHTLWSRE
jgi:hypothetical protein